MLVPTLYIVIVFFFVDASTVAGALPYLLDKILQICTRRDFMYCEERNDCNATVCILHQLPVIKRKHFAVIVLYNHAFATVSDASSWYDREIGYVSDSKGMVIASPRSYALRDTFGRSGSL